MALTRAHAPQRGLKVSRTLNRGTLGPVRHHLAWRTGIPKKMIAAGFFRFLSPPLPLR